MTILEKPPKQSLEREGSPVGTDEGADEGAREALIQTVDFVTAHGLIHMERGIL